MPPVERGTVTNLYDGKIYSLIIDPQMKGLHGLIIMGAT